MKNDVITFIIILVLFIEVSDITGRPRSVRKKGRLSTSTTTKPLVPVPNNESVIAQFGSTAQLKCQIPKNITDTNVTDANVTVTWKKEKDGILTLNNVTLVNDKRFLAKTAKIKNNNYWLLRIRYTQDNDVDMYECLIEAGGFKKSVFFNLTLEKARAVIKDANDTTVKTVNAGFPLRLSCFLENSIEAPQYIFWYKENRVINYDLTNGSSIREGRQGSELIFPSAQPYDTGNYSCVPSNAQQASVYVKVQEKKN